MRSHIYSETFKTPHGQCVSFYSAKNRNDIIHEEKCVCNAQSVNECRCRALYPPSGRFPYMERSLFKHSRPFLLYTIYRVNNPDIRINFLCKIQKEVDDEIFRLNSKENHAIMWNYIEEKEYNLAALADYSFQIEKQNFNI